MTKMRAVSLACLVLLAASLFAGAETYTLVPTPKTVTWGYYDASAPPALRIHSGDTVRVTTSLSSSPQELMKAGVPAGQIPASLGEIFQQVTNKGPGPHILTGPIYIEGAEPGDTLEIRIQRIDLALPFGYNVFVPGYGALPDQFPYARTRIIPLDRERLVARFGSGITIPLHPFFGSMGVAPPELSGRISSIEPWIHGGNMDNRELVAGTILYLPVHAPGALFSIGDAHANQGNGEVDLTALETALVGTLQFVVRKDMHILYPRAETPSDYISMGFSAKLEDATRLALIDMINFLVQEKHLTRDDAYMLISIAGNVDDTQLVDGNQGAHVLMPKAIFASAGKMQ